MNKTIIFTGIVGLIIGILLGLYLIPKPQPELVSPLVKAYETTEYKETEAEYVETIEEPQEITGKASYYNRGICEAHGTSYGVDCHTASGALFDDTALTSACPSELLGKFIIVTHNEKEVTLECTDTGSFNSKYNRVLDLSEGAFKELAPLSQGVIEISYIVKE